MNIEAPTPADRALFEALLPAVLEAGAAIRAVRAAGVTVTAKADCSPVTEADRQAEAILLAALGRLAPSMPVVAEEEVAAGRIPEVGAAFLLVDALDGTKEFVGGGNDFTVNVGLVRDGVPVAGIVHAPADGRLYLGLAGEGAWRLAASGERTPVAVRRPPSGGIDIVASKSHRTQETDAFIARFPGARVVAAGSSLKFCTLAEGAADLYPRLGPTSQWDTAAGDAILRAAGGRVVTFDRVPLRYGPTGRREAAGFGNPSFVAAGLADPFP